MKKNILILVLVIIIFVLGVFVWKRNNKISPTQDASVVSNSVAQENCSAQAMQYVIAGQNALYADFQKNATYTAHYNNALGHCFALIENPYLDKDDGSVTQSILVDINKGGSIAVCNTVEKDPKRTGCYYGGNVANSEAYNIEKFNAFVKPYMSN